MATKTLSVDLAAYERLRLARRVPDESFSSVIKRATWPEPERSCGGLLRALDAVPPLSGEALDALDLAQADDKPPEPKWVKP